MKLKKLPFTKRRLLAMMVGMVAYGGVAQAQFTGIGLTDPDATLHVRPITAGTDEPLQVESIIDYAGAPAYTDVLLHDPTTGLFRRESVADLLEDNGQWVIVAGELVPRNAPFSGHIAFTATTMEVNVPTDITGTLDVTGNTSVTGTLGATGAVDFDATLNVDGNTTLVGTLDIGTVAVVTTVAGTDEVLFQAAGTDLVQSITVTNLLAESSYWDLDSDVLTPSATAIEDEISIADGDVDITATDIDFVGTNVDVTGAFGVTGNSTLTGTLNTTGAVDFDATLNVDGNTTLVGTLEIGTVAVGTTVVGTDEILYQEAGTDLVRSITVTNLLAESSYWDLDADVLTPSATAIEDEISIADGDVDITATDIDFTGTNVDITGAFGVTGNSTLTGTLNTTGAVDFDATLNVDGNTTLVGTLDIGTVAVVTTVAGADEVLFQAAGTDLVQSITVTNLLAESSYWDLDSDVLTPSATAIEDEISIADGDVDITAADIDFVGTNVDVTGAFGVTGNSTLTGTLNTTGAVDFDATLNVDGNTDLIGTLSIGTVAEISGSPLAATDEILLQRAGTNLVEYVTVEDLVSSNSEWVYEDNGTSGTVDAADRIYVRRLDATVATDDAVYVDGIGNMVVDATKAYQFGAATSQINAVGITAAADYTVDINGGSLTFATDADEDVSFTENSEPWLYYQASADYGPANAFGNAGSERGRVGINTDAPEATLHVAGNIVASNVTVTSDRRFKKDIKDISGALDLVKALRGVSYDFRADEFPKENFDSKNHIGFIAQEIREVLPQTVMERGDGFLTVDYAAVTPVLVEAVQELSKQVEALQAENATLRSASEKSVGAVSTKQLRELEARLADMDARLQEVAGRK